MVMSTCFSCRGLGLESQQPHDASQPSRALIPMNLMPSSGPLRHCMHVVHINPYRHTQRHIIKNNINTSLIERLGIH